MNLPFKTPPLWNNSFYYKVSYRRVYKSASCSIVTMLKQQNEANIPQYDKAFSVIREPVSRALSIYNQLSRYNDFGTPESFFQRVLDTGFWDAHQMQQVWFLGGWIERVKLFRMDQMQEVADFIGFKEPIPIHNASKSTPEVSEELEQLVSYIYEKDFALYYSI